MSRFQALKKILGDTWADLPEAGKMGTKIGAGLAASGAGAAGINLINDELSGKNAAQRAILRKIAEIGEKPEELLVKLGQAKDLFL